MSCLAFIDAALVRRLLEPDPEIAAVFSDIHRDVLDSRSAGIVLRVPTYFVVVAIR